MVKNNLTGPLLLITMCFGIFVLFPSLVPKVKALKRSLKVNEFMLEDQLLRNGKDHAVKMARDYEMEGNVNLGPIYNTEPFQPHTNPQKLLVFIGDYANNIRRNKYALDNAVESRTGKQGNIKVKKSNQFFTEPPCSCEFISQIMDLGANVFPRYVETRNCSGVQQNCQLPNRCMENLYDISVLRRRKLTEEHADLEIPTEFNYRWIAEKRPISVGCICSKGHFRQA